MILRGLGIWAIFVFIFGILAFLLYKFLSNVARFEERRAQLKSGFLGFFVCAASFLFLPAFLLAFSGNFVQLFENVKDGVLQNAADEIEKNREFYVENALDSLLVEKRIERTREIEEAKNDAVKNAANFTKGKSLFKSVKVAIQLFEKDGEPILKNVSDEHLKEICEQIFSPIQKSIQENSVKIKAFPKLFDEATKSAPFSKILTDEDEFDSAEIEKSVKTFVLGILILASALSILVGALLFVAMIFLRAEKNDGKNRERKKLFEFNKNIFEKISAMK